MAARKLRSAAERAAVLADIAARYRAGATQAAIGAALSLSQQQISLYLGQLATQWRTQAGADTADKLAQELAKIDLLEAEATREYARSKRPSRKVVTQVGGLDSGKEVTTTEGRIGDVRFLERIGWCIEQRLKLFGLYAQSESGLTVLIKAYGGLDMEQV